VILGLVFRRAHLAAKWLVHPLRVCLGKGLAVVIGLAPASGCSSFVLRNSDVYFADLVFTLSYEQTACRDARRYLAGSC
jgi:hypothetical protein